MAVLILHGKGRFGGGYGAAHYNKWGICDVAACVETPEWIELPLKMLSEVGLARRVLTLRRGLFSKYFEPVGPAYLPAGYMFCYTLLGPFHGAIAVPSVTRCRCRRRRCGHRCAGGARQYR